MSESNPLTEQLRQIAAADPGVIDALGKATSIEAALQLMADASARTGLPLDLTAARQTMAQSVPTALSDDALNAVAGGGVNLGNVLTSVITLGYYCAAISIFAATRNRDCGAEFRD